MFLSGLDYGLVSLTGVGNWLVRLFSIPVYSPRDKRGKRGSRNRGLGFAIGADYGRIVPQKCGINALSDETTSAGCSDFQSPISLQSSSVVSWST